MKTRSHDWMQKAELFTAQEWLNYSNNDHLVWRTLYERRLRELRDTGSRVFLSGCEAIGLRPEHVPNLHEVNARLEELTGWRSVPVTGFLPGTDFFRCLAHRRFPTTVTVRPPEQLEYVPEPDIFHDVFGHVPLHADPVFADFLEGFGHAALLARSEEEAEGMGRLFWFTVEFGLIREAEELRVYGSGLISSAKDAANALGPGCDRRAFSLDEILQQPVETDRLQDVLFMIDSFDELFTAVEEMAARLRS